VVFIVYRPRELIAHSRILQIDIFTLQVIFKMIRNLHRRARFDASAASNLIRSLQLSSFSSDCNGVVVSDEVFTAVAQGKPVVALESTIISHGGMPYPVNYEVGLLLEKIVRDHGAIPATCAIVNGVPKVGLTHEELDMIANAPVDTPVSKASRRDLAYMIASGKNASTTVSGTMVLASRAGICVFATGGIGGVHRGDDGKPSSADLNELGKTPVTVVCSGVKSILDIGATLEVLETEGVPVVSYKANAFPSFFTADSGFVSPLRADSPAEIAKLMVSMKQLKLEQGVVVAVPNPRPFADEDDLKKCIDEAIVSAKEENISGPRITPYLLAAVNRLTDGASLEANKELVFQNAEVAALIARSYSDQNTHSSSDSSSNKKVRAGGKKNVLVFGGIALDCISTVTEDTHVLNASNPGSTTNACGGVGFNVAKSLASHDISVQLMSIVADDSIGKELLRSLTGKNFSTSGIHVLDSSSFTSFPSSNAETYSTARYTAIHDSKGELIVSTADMDIFNEFRPENVQSMTEMISSSGIIAMDANFPVDTMRELANVCEEHRIPLFLDPTSDYKAKRCASCIPYVDAVKPNISELVVILQALKEENHVNLRLPDCFEEVLRLLTTGRAHDATSHVVLNDVQELSMSLWKLMDATKSSVKPVVGGKHVITSMGDRGAVWINSFGNIQHIPCAKTALSSKKLVNSNGAGDAFYAAVIANAIERGTIDEDILKFGVDAARKHIME